MKIKVKKTGLSCLFCLSFAASLMAQIKAKDLPLSYEHTKDTILTLVKGDVVHVTLDTVYLFNRNRYQDMQDLMSFRDFISDKDPMAKAFSTVWDNHSKSLDSLEKYIALLKTNAENTTKTGIDLAESTKKITEVADNKLGAVTNQLLEAQNKLDAANKHLDASIVLIKKEVKWKWLKNGALVAIGVVLGYIAAK